MRHAKSSWDNEDLDDHDRPLKKRGKSAAAQMAAYLRLQGIVPQRLISSSAVRATQTARIVVEEFGNLDLQIAPDLYHASVDRLLETLRQLPADRATLLVGHNPGLEELLEMMREKTIYFPTAAIAVLVPEVGAESFAGESLKLVDIWRPKDLFGLEFTTIE